MGEGGESVDWIYQAQTDVSAHGTSWNGINTYYQRLTKFYPSRVYVCMHFPPYSSYHQAPISQSLKIIKKKIDNVYTLFVCMGGCGLWLYTTYILIHTVTIWSCVCRLCDYDGDTTYYIDCVLYIDLYSRNGVIYTSTNLVVLGWLVISGKSPMLPYHCCIRPLYSRE